MALVDCPECVHPVSEEAPSCPHCGQVLNERSRATMILWFGILGIYPVIYLAPFAWVMGNRELEGIEAGRRPQPGLKRARIGRRLGMVGTLLWGSMLLFLVIAMSA